MHMKEAFDKVPVLTAARPSSLATLIPCAALRRFPKGSHLFWDKDDVSQVYFLIRGSAALYKMGVGQEKKVISIYGVGMLLNEEILDEKPASASCEFLASSLVLCFDRQQFLYACQQDFHLTKAVLDSMALKLRKMYRQMKNTSGALRGDRRIASKLWKLSKDYGISCHKGVKIDFPLTITYLADLLGAKRETVSRQLKSLTERGLVTVEKNCFIIPDRDELRKYFDKP